MAAALRVGVRVVLLAGVRLVLLVRVRGLRVLLAPRAQRQAAHRTSPAAGAAGVAVAASPAAAAVAPH